MDFFKILNGGIGVSMSNFDRLWVKKFSGWPETELTGLLPLTFLSEGSALTDYRIYGTESGAGVQTENLVYETLYGYYIASNGAVTASLSYNCAFAKVAEGAQYTISVNDTAYVYAFFTEKPTKNSVSYNNSRVISDNATFTSPITGYIAIRESSTNIDAMLTSGSTAPTTYIPYGYKIPILNTSGVTENICNGTESVGGGYGKRLYFDKDKISSSTSILYVSINSGSTQLSNVSVYLNSTYKRAISGSNTFTFNIYLTAQDKSDIKESEAPYIRIYKSNTYMTAISEEMITLATPPDHYIPHRYESNYDLFIGDSKLGEDEYLDYEEQKIYKDVSGTLTPTDPPVPFPALSTYQGENTLSSEETVGEVTIKGRIKEAP